MDNRAIDNKQRNIYRELEHKRINDAFASVLQLMDQTGIINLKDEVEQLKISYSFMLQYLSRGILDPQREQVLQRIVDSLYLITDRIVMAAKADSALELFYARRRELESTPLNDIVNKWKAALHKHELLSSVPAQQQNRLAIAQILQECERQETAMFNKVWCSFPTTHDDAMLLNDIIVDNNTPVHVQCLILSALFLGLMTLYDNAKLAVICHTYASSSHAEVQVRALTYAILAMYAHSKRVATSATIKPHVEALADNSHLEHDISTIQFLLARSRNTDNITRRVRENLMPDIMNMSPDLMRKIKDKNSPIDLQDLEANPEWQEMLENSGFTKKMEEFNEMQLAGNDVFISTFSHLKSFPFFRTLSNWFLPFIPGHSALHSTLGDNAETLAGIVGDAPLCNSDKYSFCLSLGSIPESQRQMMLNQVQAQHGDLKELKNTQLPDNDKEREAIANRHLQDLYRFFKLFSRKREFVAVFDKDMDLTGLPLLQSHTCRRETMSIIAEFYFKNEFYEDAIKYFTLIMSSSDSVDPVIFQKTGFCHQNLGNTREALRCYKRYLLAHDNDPWTIKHMAACYRAMKRYDKAIECYQLVEQLQPDSVATTLSLGNCLLEADNVPEALKYYYKADFLNGAKHRAWRPIAWCSFLTGNSDRALSYYDKIINEDQATSQDYMNRGHVFLCAGQIADAINSYRESLSLEGNIDSFRKAFANDARHLNAQGISNDDIALVIDSLQA